jgi:hypothetical protein
MCTEAITQCKSASVLQTCTVVGGCTSFTTSPCSAPLVCERNAPAACMDPGWAEWPMPNDVADVDAGAPNQVSYTSHGDGTVTDNVTGLMWQQTLPTIAADGGTAARLFTWDQAQAYCPILGLGGHDDWRLPSQTELLSIVDYTIATPGPTIDLGAFPGTPANFFWSSTPVVGSSTLAWGVDFATGGVNNGLTSSTVDVRCVR